MAKIKKQSLVDQIYAILREEILTLKYPLGGRINVNEVQEKYGVSSTPLREALNRLQQEGLVVIQTNIGASVTTLNAHDVEEIEEVAYALQTAAVNFSLARGNRELMFQKICDQVQRYASARNTRENLKAFYDLIGVFYHNCGNRRLDSSMIAIQSQVLLLRYIYAECPGSGENLDILEQIRDGVQANDPESILGALKEHIDRSHPEILRWLQAHNS